MIVQTHRDPALISRIEDALNQLRPYLEADSGNVTFLELTKDMVVKLKFTGACRSCSMSTMTLRAGIEQTILRMIPEVKAVQADAEGTDLIK